MTTKLNLTTDGAALQQWPERIGVLLEGVPGVAKTTLSKVFARVLGIQYQRLQFTPDLLPSDVTGTYIFDRKQNEFVLRKGPLFCQVLLADEVNRAPAKTQ